MITCIWVLILSWLNLVLSNSIFDKMTTQKWRDLIIRACCLSFFSAKKIISAVILGDCAAEAVVSPLRVVVVCGQAETVLASTTS